MTTTAQRLNEISKWIDDGNRERDSETMLWLRIGKVTEEAGEATAALIGYTGANPRKGYTHGRGDVEKELLDVALTALGAVAHLYANNPAYDVLGRLASHIEFVHDRAGLGGAA